MQAKSIKPLSLQRLSLITVSVMLLMTGCGGGSSNSNNSNTTDTQAPTNVNLTEVVSNSDGDISAKWQLAKDDTTPAEQLVYQLHASTDPNFTPDPQTLIYTGNNSDSANVMDKLTGGKTYYIRLVVIDKDNKQTVSDAIPVSVQGGGSSSYQQPSLTISNQTSAKVNQTIDMALNGGNLTDVNKITWDYGDNSTLVTVTRTVAGSDGLVTTTSHSYAESGEVTITATFYNSNNDKLGTVSQKLTIAEDGGSGGDSTATGKLPATGMTKCADYPYNKEGRLITGHHNDNYLDCSLNYDADGDPVPAGQDGHVQAGQKMSYTLLKRNDEECVKDNVTGLIWEKKTDDDGLRDKDNTYTWYNPDPKTNGSDVDTNNGAGVQNGGNCKGSNCDTQAYIQALNNANYCGYSDWRMPSYGELNSIVDYGRINPAINPIFGDTKKSMYLSSSPHAKHNFYVWYVYFDSGRGYFRYEKYAEGKNAYYVRAVRSDQ